MISQPDFQNLENAKDERAARAWSIGASIVLNVLVWSLVSWRVLVHLTSIGAQKPEQTLIVTASQLRVEQPARQPEPQRHAAPPPRSQAPVRAQIKEPPRPQTAPKELAHIQAHAPPQPVDAPRRLQAASLAEQLAQQQVAFQNEARELNANRSATSVATADPNAHDTTGSQFHASFSGTAVLEGKGDGYLEPLKWWKYNGQNCYYGKYYWTYPTGGMEIAIIPWAFCFDPREDPIAHGIHEFPFPLPLPGYHLPAGTQLAPIEKDVYEDWLAHQ